MRLKRLDLARYGKFTDRVLEFGERPDGEPDLHIVYGPNEAGKSTAFAAFLDLLFGIEARSRYDFIHPYPTMRIGACLELADGARELVRLKKTQNSLLDRNDRPVADGVIAGALGGLDRESYRLRFSLDDETLEDGGETILASKGDLGQLLFSASAGLADLSRTLIGLREKADEFYKYRSRSSELAKLKAELAELKEERARIDIFANQYAQLIGERDRTAAQYEEANSARGRLRSRIEDIQRRLTALPRLAALRGIRESLLPLAALPEPPSGWPDTLPRLQENDVALAVEIRTVADEIARISAELDNICVDEAALALAGRVDTLAELRARHAAAEKELPDCHLELRQAELAVSAMLARLGRKNDADPAQLLLSASRVGVLREAIERFSVVETQVEAARREQAEAQLRLEEARARLSAAGDDAQAGRRRDTNLAALSQAVAVARDNDSAARRRVAERACRQHRAALGERIASCKPWVGTPGELAALVAPQRADFERWRAALTEASRQIDNRGGEIERLETERLRLQAEIDAMGGIAGVVSEQDAARVRSEREAAWASHRRQLDSNSADHFEAVLRQDDIVTNGRLRHEKEIARLKELMKQRAVLEADLARQQELLGVAETRRAAVAGEIAAFLRAMTPLLPEDMDLARLEGWLSHREKALDSYASLLQAERDLSEALADGEAARGALAQALDRLGVPCDADAALETLLLAADAALSREAELISLRSAVGERERELKARDRAVENAAKAEQDWRADWAKACAGCWLTESGEQPPVTAVREILIVTAELGPALEKRAMLAHRARKMEGDRAAFTAEAQAIAEALGFESEAANALETAHRIEARLREARIAKATRDKAAEALAAAEVRQRSLLEARAIHDARMGEMLAFFAVDTLTQVGVKLRDIARKAELEKQADAAARDILDMLGAPSLEAAEALLAAADRAALDEELAALKARAEDEDQRVSALYSEFSKAADRLDAVGGDDAAARIEEKRRTALLDIEDKARRYLRLRVGIVAAEHALRAYRDRHRSSMMSRASEAFRIISRGAYTGLATQLDKDSEILIAVAADGASKVASNLSKGTRFQLYLALRVAGYYEFADARGAVPFIADDIMETFDDDRAREAFRLFAGMAQTGQVIYLTHHRHLCDIARDVCPGVRIHDLSARAA
jgi:uncharacterized protein YhaN